MAYTYIPDQIDTIDHFELDKQYTEDIKAIYNKIKFENPRAKNFMILDFVKPKIRVVKRFEKVVGKDYKTSVSFGVISAASKTPSTREQEISSLKIFENILSSKQTTYKSFERMYIDILKTFPNLDNKSSWYKSFEKQFYDLIKTTKLKNDNYDVYNRDKGFMDFISTLVKKFGYSQKDTWNPADMWLIKSTTYNEYKKRLNKAVSIFEINDILREAWLKHEITGVSLKKNDGKNLKYELVNIELTELPKVEFKNFTINVNFSRGNFTTNYGSLEIKYMGSIYKMYIRTMGDAVGNVIFEFVSNNGKARLGNVPKEDISALLKTKNLKITNHTNFKKFNRDQLDNFVKNIKSKRIFKINGKIDEVVDNIANSWLEKGRNGNTVNMCQILEFGSQLTHYNDKELQEMVTDLFYMAQKKGDKFGPFGKLY